MSNGSPKINIFGHKNAYRGRKASFILAGKKIPPGYIVMGKLACASLDCVNHEHSRAGTKADLGKWIEHHGKWKTADRRLAAKKAMRANPKVKLDPEKVSQIRASSLTALQEANNHGVSVSAIRAARSGKTWLHTL